MVALARFSSRVLLLGLTLSACDAEVDYVGPGYYGVRSAPESQRDPSVAPTGGGAPLSSSTGGSTPAAGGTTAAASGGTASEPPVATGGMAMPSESGGSDGPPPAAGGACDMSGRWLVTTHSATDALGQFQIAQRWFYYEITQTGDSFVVDKGLFCGQEAIGLGAFAVTADFRGAWDGIRENMRLDGRTGTSRADGAGCFVRFDRAVTVVGATVPYYLDESTTLPAPEEVASNGAPGSEDWDGDGHPGITGNVSGVVTGDIYLTPRNWEELEGTVPSLSGTLTLDHRWNQTTNLVGYDGPALLTTAAVVAGDPALHFAQAARLADGQATGDDAAVCQAVIDLAPTLTPEASTPDAIRIEF